MLKNTTPRQISIYVSLILSLSLLLVLVLFNFTSIISIPWGFLFLFVLAFFCMCYFVLIFTLQKYIYRKVKLIYKSIHKLKRTSSEKLEDKVEVDSDVLSDVEKDVSEWAASKEQEIETLRSLEQYRRNFLGNISHELKTPIFNIQGYLYTLLDGGVYDENINLDYLKRAEVNVQRLQTIVEDLESISRLESGELQIEYTSFNIRDLVEECIDEYTLIAKKRKINLQVKESAGNNFMVSADKENIRQVLNNLIANSIKYGKKNGTTKIGFYDMDDYLLVEIADNGIGIEKKDINHVFDRFYRVDKSRSRDIGGSGLGLSIVKHIIEAHKQTINLRSTPGLGSTFGFTLEKS